MCVNTLGTTRAFFPSLGGFSPLSENTLTTLKWWRFLGFKVRTQQWYQSYKATFEQQHNGSHTQSVCAICGGVFLLLKKQISACFLSLHSLVVFFFCFQVDSILEKASLSLPRHSYNPQQSDLLPFSLHLFIFQVKKVQYSLHRSIFYFKTCSVHGHG